MNNNTQNKRLTDGEIDTCISQMGSNLSSFPKHTIALPLSEGQPSSVEICYNGYVIRIKCGVSVDVPEPIYMLLKHSGKLTV